MKAPLVKSASAKPKLLGPFDELLMGWASREEVLGANTHVITKNGIFFPIAVLEGKAVGSWKVASRQLELFPDSLDLDPQVFDDEIADINRFLEQ